MQNKTSLFHKHGVPKQGGRGPWLGKNSHIFPFFWGGASLIGQCNGHWPWFGIWRCAMTMAVKEIKRNYSLLKKTHGPIVTLMKGRRVEVDGGGWHRETSHSCSVIATPNLCLEETIHYLYVLSNCVSLLLSATIINSPRWLQIYVFGPRMSNCRSASFEINNIPQKSKKVLKNI